MKGIVDCKSGELIDIVSWFEDPRFLNTVRRLLIAEEDKDIEKLICAQGEAEANTLRGAIKKIRWFVSLHDRALEELQERKADTTFAKQEEESAEDA